MSTSGKIARFPFFSRMALFLATNLAVLLLLGVVLRLTGLEQMLAQSGIGLQLRGMLVFSAIFGFMGRLYAPYHGADSNTEASNVYRPYHRQI